MNGTAETGSVRRGDVRRTDVGWRDSRRTDSRLRHVRERRAGLRASYTVEAALLMTIILPLLMIVLNLSFFLCDSLRMTAFLQEKARLQLESTGEDVKPGGFFRLHEGKIEVSKGTFQVRTSATDEPDHPLPGERYEGHVRIMRRHPQTWIRVIRQLQAEQD